MLSAYFFDKSRRLADATRLSTAWACWRRIRDFLVLRLVRPTGREFGCGDGRLGDKTSSADPPNTQTTAHPALATATGVSRTTCNIAPSSRRDPAFNTRYHGSFRQLAWCKAAVLGCRTSALVFERGHRITTTREGRQEHYLRIAMLVVFCGSGEMGSQLRR